MKLLLFDIDGTLANTNGAGLRALDRAFEEVYGHPGILDGISLAGRTDVTIMMDAYTKAGIEFAFEELERVKNRYFELLIDELNNGKKNTLMPGIADLIPELHQNHNICLALLTGNWQRSGRMKIDHFGFNSYFPFGAFADDAVERADLVPIAKQRCEALTGARLKPKDIFVIGDTPSDILCTKPHGVISVAVAAASYSMEDLSAYNPDILLKDLSNLGEVIKILT